jgi:hypothetical protein
MTHLSSSSGTPRGLLPAVVAALVAIAVGGYLLVGFVGTLERRGVGDRYIGVVESTNVAVVMTAVQAPSLWTVGAAFVEASGTTDGSNKGYRANDRAGITSVLELPVVAANPTAPLRAIVVGECIGRESFFVGLRPQADQPKTASREMDCRGGLHVNRFRFALVDRVPVNGLADWLVTNPKEESGLYDNMPGSNNNHSLKDGPFYPWVARYVLLIAPASAPDPTDESLLLAVRAAFPGSLDGSD